MRQKRRILILAPIFPLPLRSGGHTRLFNMIKHLGVGNEIDFISPVTGEEHKYIGQLQKYCRAVVGINIDNYLLGGKRGLFRGNRIGRILWRLGRLAAGVPLEVSAFYYRALERRLSELLAEGDYDVVQVEYPRMGQYFSRRFLKDNGVLKIMVDYDLTFMPHWRRYQCEKRPLARLVRYIDYRMNRSYALKAWGSFDKLVVMSEVDRAKVEKFLPGHCVEVVPNGVDLECFGPMKKEGEPKRLVFLGGAGHYANVDGLEYFLKEIFGRIRREISDLRLRVIGEGWERFSAESGCGSAVEFTGFVEDLREYLAGTSVLVTPIRIGGGTRLKILEAMALGVPVVSTSIGCEGIAVEDGRHILVADKAIDFAEKVVQVFGDPQLREQLRQEAYKLVKERYGWETIARKMESVYDDRADAGP